MQPLLLQQDCPIGQCKCLHYQGSAHTPNSGKQSAG